MPHQCTECGHTFEDGSTEMLSGCPDCGGNKFQYFPGEVPEEPAETADPPDRGDAGVSETVGRAARRVRDFVGPSNKPDKNQEPTGSMTPDTKSDVADPGPEGEQSSASVEADQSTPTPGEDDAQRAARSEVVDQDDLPDEGPVEPPENVDGEVVATPSGERPDMETLREELNDQFESIRIVDKGRYELNLMELYDREEYIIALQENGRYVIEVPDAWRDDVDGPG